MFWVLLAISCASALTITCPCISRGCFVAGPGGRMWEEESCVWFLSMPSRPTNSRSSRSLASAYWPGFRSRLIQGSLLLPTALSHYWKAEYCQSGTIPFFQKRSLLMPYNITVKLNQLSSTQRYDCGFFSMPPSCRQKLGAQFKWRPFLPELRRRYSVHPAY